MTFAVLYWETASRGGSTHDHWTKMHLWGRIQWHTSHLDVWSIDISKFSSSNGEVVCILCENGRVFDTESLEVWKHRVLVNMKAVNGNSLSEFLDLLCSLC